MEDKTIPFARKFNHRPSAHEYLRGLGFYPMFQQDPFSPDYDPETIPSEVWEPIEEDPHGLTAAIEDLGDCYVVEFIACGR